MAMNKSEKKKIKYDAKKIGRILSFAILTIALLIGIIFSSVKVNMDMIYGPEYNGAYQASVQVLNQNNNSLDDLAKSLSDKLAPFSDKSLTVSKQGKNHLNVIVGKADYENSESYLRDQIESNGGMFVLSGTAGDTLTQGTLNDFYLTAKDAKDKRFTNKDFFTGDITTKTLSNGAGRDPFVQFGLKYESDGKQSVLAKTLQDESSTNTQQTNATNFADNSELYFITDLEEMINQLRYFYEVNQSEDATKTYFEEIIQPIVKIYSQQSNNQVNKDILGDLFGGTVNWKINGSDIPQSTNISLLDYDSYKDKFSGSTVSFGDWTKSYDEFKKVLKYFTPNTSAMPTSTFLYSADATTEDTTKTFKSWLHPTDDPIKKSDSFKTVVNTFLSNSVLFENSNDSSITPKIKSSLIKWDPQLKNYILYKGGINPSTQSSGITTSISGEVNSGQSFIVDNASDLKQDSSSVKNAFYLRTKNLTTAKKAVASIKQNALGVSYLVESISNVNPYITSTLYIVSVVFLSIIALLLAIYVLFVYRLLGLFTLIIAACAVAITLLAAVGFGIAMGPQVIAALFLIVALILDSNFIVFEGFKKNYYENKHGIVSSFKIGNKETLATAIDTLLVAFIPSIILFWVASGPLKTFGTLSIIGIALAVVCGIIIGRFIYWLILKAKFVQQNDWMLPIDTRYTVIETLRDEFAINKYTNYLENHEGKTKYTSKELMAIQNAKTKLEDAKKSYHKHLLISNAKTVKKDEKTVASINKETAWLTKFKNWLIKTFKIKHVATNPLTKIVDARIDNNNFVLDVDKQADSSNAENKSALRDKGNIVRKNRLVARGTFFLSIILIVIAIISAIVGGVTGVSWTNNVGYGQQFVVYGNEINNLHDNLQNGRFSLPDDISQKWKELDNKYSDQYENDKNSSDKNVPDQVRYYAYELKDFFDYLHDNNDFKRIGQTTYTKKIKLTDAKFDVVLNYQHVDTKNVPTNKELVALRIDSNSDNKKSRSTFKRLLVAMATGQWPNSDTMKDTINDDGGIVAYDLSPYTISVDIKNVGIAFGIALAVLVAYILIRFKWTYYVALALGLGLVIGTVVALIVMFQVPMSSEMLCGMVFVISFALTSIILVLGKGKSQLNLTNKETIEKNFSGVVELAAKIRAKKAETKATYAPMKKKMKQLRKEMWEVKKQLRKTGDGQEELEQLTAKYEELKNDYKAKKKEQVSIYKKFKYTTKQQENDLQRKNWYFKSLFSSLIKYSAWRMATLGVFYLLVGIILAATLPSIFSMGLTIIFGIIVVFAIALFISVPVWVYFEKRRIRYVYGRKKYIKSLKVSREEETVKGIND